MRKEENIDLDMTLLRVTILIITLFLLVNEYCDIHQSLGVERRPTCKEAENHQSCNNIAVRKAEDYNGEISLGGRIQVPAQAILLQIEK